MRGDEFEKNGEGWRLRDWMLAAHWPESKQWEAVILWKNNVRPFDAENYLRIQEILDSSFQS